MPTRCANSSANPSPPLCRTWACGRSAENTRHSKADMQCYIQPSHKWTVLVFQVAFEVLSFVSVVSNCWLLLLSPRLQEMLQEGGMSSTNILLLAVIMEVRRRMESLLVRVMWNTVTLCVFPWHVFTSVCLQHLLILVKVVLVVLIPDEPDWIRKEREHIEFTSMHALNQQVNLHTSYLFCILFFSLHCMTPFLSLLTEAVFWRVLIAISKCLDGDLHCPVLSYHNQKMQYQPQCCVGPGERSVGSPAGLTIHTAVPIILPLHTVRCFCCSHKNNTELLHCMPCEMHTHIRCSLQV